MKFTNIEYIKTNKKGITLTTLVVTIIVLLILSGITITTVTGDNGVIQSAQETSSERKRSETVTSVQLDLMAAQLAGDVTQSRLEEVLARYAENGSSGIIKDSSGNITGITVEGVSDTIAISELTEGITIK